MCTLNHSSPTDLGTDVHNVTDQIVMSVQGVTTDTVTVNKCLY